MYFFSNSPVKWRLTKVVCTKIVKLAKHPKTRGSATPHQSARRVARTIRMFVGETYLAGATIANEDELEGRRLSGHVVRRELAAKRSVKGSANVSRRVLGGGGFMLAKTESSTVL